MLRRLRLAVPPAQPGTLGAGGGGGGPARRPEVGSE